MKVLLASLLCLMVALQYCAAEDISFGGHIKYQPTFSRIATDQSNSLDGFLDIRTRLSVKVSPLEFNLHGLLSGVSGDTLEKNSVSSAFLNNLFLPLTGENSETFDLSRELHAGERSKYNIMLDRLNLAYTDKDYIIKLGRQAVSWGNGILFQVVDVFNPFSPVAVDREYKSGSDLAYFQYLFSDGSDLQFLIVPRRDFLTGNISDSSSSYAAKYHGRINKFSADYDIVAARHFDKVMLAAGAYGDIYGSVVRADLAWMQTLDRDFISAVLNADRSWTIGGKNIYAFIELFFNGSGLDCCNYREPDAVLLERFRRAEIFTAGRLYSASGIRIELTPLYNVFVSEVLNLEKGSGLLQLKNEFDISDDLTAVLGLNISHGATGDTISGLRQLYLRVAYYF
ncbi:MAG: hypothetical protein D6719_10360 [Candidatus Dadabacteria bacterium]|nr:MAG: hypothetical protein D6719_10360 [Candidatus Dadabacteria bacterium]